MSNFFRSAAMTLLSKTLQTLLSKYLSDVDVEGVALPSLYNPDGHSGWGVRLRNVHLREGVKLMDLPGARRKRKRRRKKVKIVTVDQHLQSKQSSEHTDSDKTDSLHSTRPATPETVRTDDGSATVKTVAGAPTSSTNNAADDTSSVKSEQLPRIHKLPPRLLLLLKALPRWMTRCIK
jgi:hypothetical protein